MDRRAFRLLARTEIEFSIPVVLGAVAALSIVMVATAAVLRPRRVKPGFLHAYTPMIDVDAKKNVRADTVAQRALDAIYSKRPELKRRPVKMPEKPWLQSAMDRYWVGAQDEVDERGRRKMPQVARDTYGRTLFCDRCHDPLLVDWKGDYACLKCYAGTDGEPAKVAPDGEKTYLCHCGASVVWANRQYHVCSPLAERVDVGAWDRSDLSPKPSAMRVDYKGAPILCSKCPAQSGGPCFNEQGVTMNQCHGAYRDPCGMCGNSPCICKVRGSCEQCRVSPCVCVS